MTDYGRFQKQRVEASTMPYNEAKEKRREILAQVRKRRAEAIKRQEQIAKGKDY